MKRIISLLVGAAVLAAFVGLTTTAYAQPGCTNATLTGNYGFSFSGFSTKKGLNGQLFPFYGAGLVTFDGLGSVSGAFTYSFKNEGGVSNNPYSASYTVNVDCTVSVTGTNGGDSFNGVIVSGGSEILATDITAPDTVNIDFKKQ
jgi:hypothetical protein